MYLNFDSITSFKMNIYYLECMYEIKENIRNYNFSFIVWHQQGINWGINNKCI